MGYVSTPIMNNPAGALAQALLIPVSTMYVNYVVDLANSIASHRETQFIFDGGAVYHLYC